MINRREVCKSLAMLPFFGLTLPKKKKLRYKGMSPDTIIVHTHFKMKGWKLYTECDEKGKILEGDNKYEILIPMNDEVLTDKCIEECIAAQIEDGRPAKYINILFYNNVMYGCVISEFNLLPRYNTDIHYIMSCKGAS